MLAPPLTAVTLRLAVSSQSIRIAIIAELLQVREDQNHEGHILRSQQICYK